MTETRLEKAQCLVDEGKVDLADATIYSTAALVRGEYENYATRIYPDGTFFCTCDWGQHYSYTDDLCVHAIAVKLVMERSDR